MRSSANRVALIVAFFTVALIDGCEDIGGPPPRIMPGVSIDGVKLGDSRAQVERLLGTPTGVGWENNVYRSHRMLAYYPERQRQLGVYFLIDSGGTFGPVDKIVMYEAYTGTTGEGIGIGTPRAEVHRMWKAPAATAVFSESSADYYCVNKKIFAFEYIADKVVMMEMMFYLPNPQFVPHICD